MSNERIYFSIPYMTGKELNFIAQALTGKRLAGDGAFTKKCHDWLEQNTGTAKALLTHSCTAALEMCALLLNIQPGDEVIMPSYTFVSTANAFVLRGGVPVFVDIRADTLNIDEQKIEAAITPRTKAIVPMHYAGISCEMDTIMAIAKKHDLSVIEDAAQGVLATYKGRSLGTLGDLGTYSFHETKNIISGEGGALLVNDKKFMLPAEIAREKGTDRSRFFRGEVDRYTWRGLGSSFLPGETVAAFLWAQLLEGRYITEARLQLWNRYHKDLVPLEQKGVLRRPTVPAECQHNAHMYYILIDPKISRQTVIDGLKKQNIDSVFHYIPLHNSPAGKELTRTHGDLTLTENLSEQILRLPLWMGMTSSHQERVIRALEGIFATLS